MAPPLALFFCLSALPSIALLNASPVPHEFASKRIEIDSTAKTIRMPIRRYYHSVALRSRQISADLTNDVKLGLYYVDACVGTPCQSISLQIDTGSSDLWMFGPGSCDANTSVCFGGTFDSSQSSTLTDLGPGFSIQYVTPGSGVIGDYILDALTIGGVTLSSVEMAVASSAVNVETGIMGIGFDTREAGVDLGLTPYPNLVDAMAISGAIESSLYSLWLDDLEANTGSVLFGGYDASKFTGSLTRLNIIPDVNTGIYDSMDVEWTSFAVSDGTGVKSFSASDGSAFNYTSTLDSGTTLTLMPPDIFDQVAAYFGVDASDTSDGGYNKISCNIGSGQLQYGFAGIEKPLVTVDYSEIAIPVDGQTYCHFGLSAAPSDSGPFLLGDTFLRSAYVVYDLDNFVIGLAQTIFQ